MSAEEVTHDAKRKRNSSPGSTTPDAKLPASSKSAFDELMHQAKRPKKPTEEFVSPASYHSSFRDLLAPYIITPEKFGPSEVIRYNDEFTVLNDAYPKSTIHILVMPRNKEKSKLHPVAALKEDKEFAKAVWKECESVRGLVAKELKRRFGGDRDWSKEIKVGVHANPSMNNMHIHVLSRDMAGKALKKRTHYNSFCTPFFIPLEKFLVDEPSLETPKRYGECLKGDMLCWRCGKNFGNKFAELKRHLEREFDDWKKKSDEDAENATMQSEVDNNAEDTE